MSTPRLSQQASPNLVPSQGLAPRHAEDWWENAFRSLVVLVLVAGAVVLGGCSGSQSQAADELVDRAATAPDEPEVLGNRELSGAEETTTSASASSTAAGPEAGPVGERVTIAQGAGLSAQEATLRPVSGPSIAVTAGDPCEALSSPSLVSRCGATGPLVWQVSSPVDGDGAEVRIYRNADDGLRSVLEAVDRQGLAWESVAVHEADLTDDGVEELIVGFRTAGSGGFLDIDVVANDGQVVLHRSLMQGEAVVFLGTYADIRADPIDDDPNCCPSRFLQETVSYVDRRWQVTESGPVEPDLVQPGLF